MQFEGVRWRCVGAVLFSAVLLACTDSEPPRASSPDLQCGDAKSGTSEADLDPAAPGAPTQEEAIDEVMLTLLTYYEGEAEPLRPGFGALVVDGRRVVVVVATAAPAGGFWADTIHYCYPFLADTGEPPHTAPLVTG